MFAPEPAESFLTNRRVVILSAEDRLPALPKIVLFQFPSSGESHPQDELSPVNKVPPRSRRISHRPQQATARLLRNSRKIRTYTNRKLNFFKMRTCEKTCQGDTAISRMVVPSGTTQISPGRKPWGRPCFQYPKPRGGATQRVGSKRSNRPRRAESTLAEWRPQLTQNVHLQKNTRGGGAVQSGAFGCTRSNCAAAAFGRVLIAFVAPAFRPASFVR
jgi:hypothetical protein